MSDNKNIVATILIYDDGTWDVKCSKDIHPIIVGAIDANMLNNWHEEMKHAVNNLDCIDLEGISEEDAVDWYENVYMRKPGVRTDDR